MPSLSDNDQLSQSGYATVYRPRDEGDLALAESMLKAAGIEYFTLNEDVQDVFGWGRFPAGFNVVTGSIEIQVAEADAAYAGELLAGLSGGYAAGEEVEGDAE